MPEVYRILDNGTRQYVGYVANDGTIRDTRKNGFNARLKTQSMRLGKNNSATYATISNFNATGRGAQG